jgi:hypothetical protein
MKRMILIATALLLASCGRAADDPVNEGEPSKITDTGQEVSTPASPAETEE